MKEIILKYALKNALDFKGTVNPKVVLGLVLRENPALRSQVPAVNKEIEMVIKEIVKLSLEEIKKRLQKIAPALLISEEKNEEGPLKPLPNAKMGKVVVRIAPSPSGPLHIGHAYGGALNDAYAKMYNGKFILRIEDTNPENIYSPAYDLIPRDVQWLTANHVAEIIIQSARLGIYYDYAEKLIQKEKAYVCTCDADAWREMKNKGEACLCRMIGKKENQQRYAKMFTSFAEGEAVVRLKTEINHKNPAMRDFPILRINEHVHPKTKSEQRVWPLMVFAVAIDDHELGITHVLNGKDHADNAMKERMIMDCFGWKHPEYKHWGRINFEGFTLSTTQTRLAIEQGEYKGWDDIRLPFLPALRRRGYQPEAFRKFSLEIGLTLNDKTVSREEFWKMINAFNKEVVEPKANRFFFVDQPVEIMIQNAPQKKVYLPVHPDFPERGKRELKTSKEIHIANSDLPRLDEEKIHRLIEGYNFTLKKGKWLYHSETYEEYKNAENRGSIIHWLPVEKNLLQVEVLKEDGSSDLGVGERGLLSISSGTIVQLERRYFACVDKVEKNKVTLWHLHR